MSGTDYRADIDGLRALAIIPVVLFHSGVSTLAGGFTGVDIFFVISGFLITGILLRELEDHHRINVIGFYAKRAARILPALLLVMCSTLIAGVVLLSPALFEVQSLAKSAVASLGFVANFYFLLETGNYFSPDDRGLPLLHTWSLAVEEQYYFVWPILLVIVGLIGRSSGNLRNCCMIAVLAITASSLAFCAWLTPVDTASAFYLPVTRAWELGIGSALAIVKRRPPAGEATASGLAGLVMVAFGLFIVREGSGFPFPSALFPTLGTAMLLWAGQGETVSLASRLLKIPAIVSIGRVSYAWYLWHWPLLAFAHLLTVGQAQLELKLCLAAVSLALSYITVKLVENPIRFGIAKRTSAGRVVLSGFLSVIAAMALAGGIWVSARLGILPNDSRIAIAFSDRSPRQQACLLRTFAASTKASAECNAAPGKGVLLLWGDSYADQWAPSLEKWRLEHPEWSVQQRTLAACPPLVGLSPTVTNGTVGRPYYACKLFNDSVDMHLSAMARPSIAVLAGNWLPRAGIERSGTISQYFDASVNSESASLQRFEFGLNQTLNLLDRKGIPTIIVFQSPHFDVVPAACVQRLGANRCYINQPEFVQEARVVNSVIDRVVKRHTSVRTLDPVDIQCGNGRCDSLVDGRIAYYDDEHVAASLAASPRALDRWAPLLNWAAQLQRK